MDRASSSSTTSTGSIPRASGSSTPWSRWPPNDRWSSSRRCARVPRPPGPRSPHLERIDLSGLAAPETAQLATIVARAALGADDARQIHERTQGNPLFIGETVRASIEDGTLELRDGRMVLDRIARSPVAADAAGGARGAHRRTRRGCAGRPRRRVGHRHRLPRPRHRGPARTPDPAGLARPARGGRAHRARTATERGGSATRSSRMRHTPGSSRRADDDSTPVWRTGSRVGRDRSRCRGWPSIARPPAMRNGRSRCSSRRPPRRPPWVPRPRRPASGGLPRISRRTRRIRHVSARPPERRRRPPRRPDRDRSGREDGCDAPEALDERHAHPSGRGPDPVTGRRA